MTDHLRARHATGEGRCRSGRHYWLDAESREKCCNGYRREFVVGDEARLTCDRPRVQDGVWVGFRWVADPPTTS